GGPLPDRGELPTRSAHQCGCDGLRSPRDWAFLPTKRGGRGMATTKTSRKPATKSSRKPATKNGHTSADYLQGALDELTKARERASGDIRSGIDSAIDRTRDAMKEAG